MAIDRDDERLLEALKKSRAEVKKLDVNDATRGWVSTAGELLDSAAQSFEDMVEREDLEELEAREALQQMRLARASMDEAFQDCVNSLDIYLGEARLSHDPAKAEAISEVAHFINRFHQGEFRSLRTGTAIKVAGKAVRLMQTRGCDTAQISALEAAMEATERSREAASDEGAEAVEAYGELVEGRSVARVCYLTARDLVSAALRFEGRHEELDAIIPSIADILSHAGISRSLMD